MKLPKGYKVKKDNKMKWLAETDTSKKVIKINKKLHKKPEIRRKGTLIDTLVHETLHAKNPKLTEKQVYKKTPKVLKKMSKVQKSKMYSTFATV